jgi:hypothetical protein
MNARREIPLLKTKSDNTGIDELLALNPWHDAQNRVIK